MKKKYKLLVQSKDKPLLILDTCVHTGKTTDPLKALFQNIGFKDIRLGVVYTDANHLLGDNDVTFSLNEPVEVCYPFGKEPTIKKETKTLLPTLNKSTYTRAASRQLREEIKNIVKDYTLYHQI